MSNNLQSLVEAYQANPTPKGREKIVLDALPLVRSIIGRIAVPKTPVVSYEDLESTGIIGLLEALDSYDPEKARFSTHAWRRVHGNIVDHLRSVDVLSRGKRTQFAEIQKAYRELQQILGQEPSDADISDYLDISLEKYHALLQSAQLRFSLSLYNPLGSPGAESPGVVLDRLENKEAREGQEAVERDQLTSQLNAVIQTLPERQQTILGMYYDGEEDYTLKDIGKVLNLTEARISQILGKIIVTLKERLSSVKEVARPV